jgi:hypothetical protein
VDFQGIVSVRRLVVHHTELIKDDHIQAFLGPIRAACDNLRSAMAKIAILALAECFEFLGRSRLEKSLANGDVLDVLLRRSACEKRFLRDAAFLALQKMTKHMYSVHIIEYAATHADNKNAKMCATAALLISECLQMLEQKDSFSPMEFQDVSGLFKALSVFLTAKDADARKEAKASLEILAKLAGRDWFEEAVESSMDHRIGIKILRELFPTSSTKTHHHHKPKKEMVARGKSLRERIQQQSGPSAHATKDSTHA